MLGATEKGPQIAAQQKDQYHASMNWIQDGPAQGLRRQHQFTKVRGGLIPSAKVATDDASSEDRNAEDGLSLMQLRSVLCPPDAVVTRPASIQQETDLQATNRSCEWGSSRTCISEPEWPADMGEMPPRLLYDALVQAGLTFPRGLGLGWDGIHPRMLSRLSDFTLKWIVCVLVQSEKSGN